MGQELQTSRDRLSTRAARAALLLAIVIAAIRGVRGMRQRNAPVVQVQVDAPDTPPAWVAEPELAPTRVPVFEAAVVRAPEPSAVAGRLRPRDLVRVAFVPVDPGRSAMGAFAAAAIALGVAGYFHGHLYHEGYRQVSVVGPLFLLNVIGSAVVILMLVRGLVLPFIGGVLSISLGAIVSIVISHTSSFFGFSEAGYQTTATVILVAEILAVVLALFGVVLGRRVLAGTLRHQVTA